MNISLTGIGWVTSDSIGRGRDYSRPPGGRGPIPALSRKVAFDEPFQHFGRLDTYSKIGITAIALTLKDAHRYAWEKKRNVGIIASSYSGCFTTDIDYFDTVFSEGGHLASPNLFVYTLPNSFLGEAAIRFGLTGTSFVICEEPLTGLQALRFAVEIITDGESDAILAGMCDTGCPDNSTAPIIPVSGAVFCLLEKATRPNRLSYGEMREDRRGGICFNGIVIENMFSLTQICVKTATKVKGF
jgi:3-oxoacyl-[acyl-carrier-protein] synthase II